ncbi:MAG: hypothetical protein ACE5Q6_08220 [Dehalococcoidia bacterium]
MTQLGSWPVLDKLLRDAEARPDFHTHLRDQANLVYRLGAIGAGYWEQVPEIRQAILSRLIPLVPRLQTAPEPKDLLERLFKLYLTRSPLEDISRALKVVSYEPRELLPEEQLYPREDGSFIASFLAWTQESDVPLAYYFWAAVSTIGSACRYNFFIDRGVDHLRMNHYMVLAGTKATGKTSALNASLEILKHVNSQVHEWQPGTNLPKPDAPHPHYVRILPADTNQETLVRLLQPDTIVGKVRGHDVSAYVGSVGLLALDELSTFLGKDNWNIQKRVPFLTCIYDEKDYTYYTQKGGKITLRDCAVSLLACCTPDWMRDAISPLTFGGGFMDRTLMIFRDPLPPPPLFPTARPRDPVSAAEMAEFLVGLTSRTHREEMIPTVEAAQWYDHWYRQQEESPDEQDTSVKRRANHLWKLAATLSISDNAIPYIHMRHFQLAARIFDLEWTYFHKLLGVLGSAPEGRNMDYIESILLRFNAVEGRVPGHMLQSVLFRMLRHREGLTPPTTRAAPILKSMEAANRIRVVPVVTKGRAGRGYQLTQEAMNDYPERKKHRQPNPASTQPKKEKSHD